MQNWRLNSSIWPVDGNITGSTTPDQIGAESKSNEGVLHIPQSSKTSVSGSDTV